MPVIESERYEIDPKPIGRGGFGEVYQAYDLLFERKVVVKTIVASHLYGINEPEFRRQFFKEAVISARLGAKSPYIVEVLDYGYDRSTDIPFFVMEFVNGHDLMRECGAFSVERSFQLLGNMLHALGVAHEKGVIHSDISPDNIMYDEKDKIFKLNDFGLARLLNSTLMSRGSVKSLVGGKPGYLPLNDWQTGDRSPHSDLYALAITITQLVTGQVPMWQFSSGAVKPPDILPAFQLKLGAKLDQRHFEKHDKHYSQSPSFPFSCRNTDSGSWHFTGEPSTYVCDLTAQDLVDGVLQILTQTLVTVSDTVDFFSGRIRARVMPKEEACREQEEKEEAEADARKKEARKQKGQTPAQG